VPRLPALLRPLYPYLQPAYVRANRYLAPATIRLSRGMLPSGVVMTLEEAAATSGGSCVEARPPEMIVRPPFVGLPADMAPLEPATNTVIPRLAVAELPQARVLGRSRALITGRGDLVQELSHYFGTTHPRQHPIFTKPFHAPPQRLDGRVGLLASRGDVNYYHFLIDVIPRLGVLEQAAQGASPERWYVPAQTRFQRELLDLVGIDEEHRINADEVPHIQAECLVVPSLPSVVGEKNPPWVVEFLRKRLMRDVMSPTSRSPLYVTRRAGVNNRAVVDEEKLIAFLSDRGFEIVDPGELSVVEQIRVFASASVIVSAHGAALANLVFATPGTPVIELFPPSSVLPDYWRLASSAGLTYRYLATRAPHRNQPGGGRLGSPRGRTIVSDIVVDMAGLNALLDETQVA
jgi:capsular polysaccharide biosynthesis protein